MSFTIAGGPRQRSHFQVRVPWDLRMIIFYFFSFETPPRGGPGPRIHIPQVQVGPVIFPGTGFPFRRLVRFAGLRWKYSTPPPHGNLTAI
jgi:hypothetical protein